MHMKTLVDDEKREVRILRFRFVDHSQFSTARVSVQAYRGYCDIFIWNTRGKSCWGANRRY